MTIVENKPKDIRVLYKGDGTLRHTGIVPKYSEPYVFTPGISLPVPAVPVDDNGRPVSPIREARGDTAAWDTGDQDFFRDCAEKNPETWEIQGDSGILEKAKAVVVPKAKEKKTPGGLRTTSPGAMRGG